MKKEFLTFEKMQYIIGYPDDYKQGEKRPILFFLHGAGTRGTDIEKLNNNVFFSEAEKVKNFPFIVIAPLCKDTWYDVFETLKRFTITLSNMPYADKKHIYAMGASMGGYGVWQLGMSLPEIFAGIVPICGGGLYWDAGKLANVPVWAFHGELDVLVYAEESKKMVEKVNKAGGNAKLTLLPDVYHDAWLAVFNNQEVYDWLLSLENNNDKKIEELYNDVKLFG
jgi:predicted peptidase